MAQTRKNTNSKNRTNKTNTRKNEIKQNDYIQVPDKSSLINIIRNNKLLKYIVSLLIILTVIALDLLISWNGYDRFFMILGIEILILAIIMIIILVYRSTLTDSHSKDTQRFTDEG